MTKSWKHLKKWNQEWATARCVKDFYKDLGPRLRLQPRWTPACPSPTVAPPQKEFVQVTLQMGNLILADLSKHPRSDWEIHFFFQIILQINKIQTCLLFKPPLRESSTALKSWILQPGLPRASTGGSFLWTDFLHPSAEKHLLWYACSPLELNIWGCVSGGQGSAGLMVGFDDLGGLLQLEWFYNSICWQKG